MSVFKQDLKLHHDTGL